MDADRAFRPEEVEAVCLDVGNTVVGMDLDVVARCLHALGGAADATALEAAEAAARPALSRRLQAGEARDRDAFALYLEEILGRLPSPPLRRSALAAELARALRDVGTSDALWCRPLFGAVAALERLRALDLPLVAVSNSDGTAAASLERAGAHPAFRAVVDSFHVGWEKPDPRIFHAALEHLPGVDPARVVHVGDLFAIDVAGARAAGLQAVLLDPAGAWGDVGCARARDLGELADLIAAARRR